MKLVLLPLAILILLNLLALSDPNSLGLGSSNTTLGTQTASNSTQSGLFKINIPFAGDITFDTPTIFAFLTIGVLSVGLLAVALVLIFNLKIVSSGFNEGTGQTLAVLVSLLGFYTILSPLSLLILAQIPYGVMLFFFISFIYVLGVIEEVK